MPLYRIHRLRESLRLHFRQTPHTSGIAIVKPKDYELADSVEAENPYAAWSVRKEAGQSLQVGDVLEVEGGTLQIYKFIGFEPAQWFVPEPKTPESVPVPALERVLDAPEKV